MLMAIVYGVMGVSVKPTNPKTTTLPLPSPTRGPHFSYIENTCMMHKKHMYDEMCLSTDDN